MEQNKINFNQRIYTLIVIMLSLLVIVSFNISSSYAAGTDLPFTATNDRVVVPQSIPQDLVSIQDSLTRSNCQGLFAGGFDPSDNLMSSIMSFCLSGVLVNLHRLEQQECERILCEYRAAQQGISPIGCAKQNAYNTCMITGQGFDVVEGMLIGALRQNIRNILENPLGFGIEQLRKVLERQVETCIPNCSTPNSKVAAIGLAALEIPAAFQTIQNLMNQLSSVTDRPETACERLEDVRLELEEMLDQYYSSRN